MKGTTNQNELRKMIRKYLAGEATPQQEEFLEAYFKHFENRDEIIQQLSDHEQLQLRDEMEANILGKITVAERPKIRQLSFLFKAAAAVLIFISAGAWFYFANQQKGDGAAITQRKTSVPAVAPGGNKAFLTLGNGQRISLNDANIGEVTRQGGVVVSKTKNGQLTYDLTALSQEAGALIATNTIETPRGGEYQVILPDGTKVWLNAASKLVFPTAFKGKERKVELIGEAYFEVAKNKAMPFRVASNNQVVEVLGTHFNVSAYADDAIIKTTLLEGSVKVAAAKTLLLVPGQQSAVGLAGNIKVSNVNVNEAIGWKNGLFVFSNEEIESLMRKVSRWYNVDIEYKGTLTKEGFVGSVSRFKNINELLTTLELTGMVHFKVEGRRVTVMP